MTTKNAGGNAKIVIIGLEGVVSQSARRAILRADLVIVPMQPTALDAGMGSEALALVCKEEDALRRAIRHAVIMIKTSAAVKSRVQKSLKTNGAGQGSP